MTFAAEAPNFSFPHRHLLGIEGLSRAEIVSRLKAALPETINKLTPGGRLPDETEASGLI